MAYEIRHAEGGRELWKDGKVVYVETPVLLAVYRRVLAPFNGSVLTTGLGMGRALEILCDNPAVRHVTCLEQDPELIAHIGFFNRKARILCADAWFWEPDRGFDMAFHDLECEITQEALARDNLLMARYDLYGVHDQRTCLEECLKG